MIDVTKMPAQVGRAVLADFEARISRAVHQAYAVPPHLLAPTLRDPVAEGMVAPSLIDQGGIGGPMVAEIGEDADR